MNAQSILHIDFETRSTVDLKQTTTDVYAKDPSTDVWCLAYAFDDDPIELLDRKMLCDAPYGAYIIEHVKNGGKVYGHNVTFEWYVWNNVLCQKYDWPELPIEQCYCTMAMSYAMALPGALEKACPAAGLDIQKDMSGHRLMLQMAKPRKIHEDGTVEWWDDPEKIQRLHNYCKQDVEAERALHQRLRDLSDQERELWLLDHKINTRGVYADLSEIKKAKHIVNLTQQQLDIKMQDTTAGLVEGYNKVKQLTEFLNILGVHTNSVAKDVVETLLKQELPVVARTVLEIRQDGAKSSTAKIDKMKSHASADGRIRNILQYHGAATGRWAGRAVQLHNFPRPTLEQDEIEHLLDSCLDNSKKINLFHGNPLTAIASCLRGLIRAQEGNELTAADYSNIEGRVLAWLATEKWKLQAFDEFDNGFGPDLYTVTAGSILGKSPFDIDKEERQTLGKVPELALGYEGGVGAFQQMAVTYGVNMTDHFDAINNSLDAEYIQTANNAYKQRGLSSGINKKAWIASEAVKLAWRAKHPNICAYWKKLNEGAIAAVENPEHIFQVNNVKFIKKGSFLWLQLPSKRLLCYPYPRVINKPTPWGAHTKGLQYKGVDAVTKKWTDIETYGGKLAENVTQAVARDILAEAILRLEDKGYEIVLHIHDEIVCEAQTGEITLKDMCREMEVLPVWATGLPVKAEGWQGKRFRK